MAIFEKNTLVDDEFILASEFRLVIQVKTPETDMYKPMNDHA
jgi:hypothetical protein